MKTLYGSGDTIQVTAAGTYTAGVGTLVGTSIFGVALASATTGQQVALQVEGEVEIGKTSALAISVGDALYWDDTNKVVNKTSSSQREVGVATGDAANPSPTVRMKLVLTVRTSVAA